MKATQFTSFTGRLGVPNRAHNRSFSTKGTESDELVIESIGNTRKVTLNRPKALNALNLPMINKLLPLYNEWTKDPKLKVLMKGAGGKAFCAGGDIRAVYDAGKAREFGKGTLTSDFFYNEYQLNHLISLQKIPQVAILNGITMGGGVGLSVHGEYRVATDNSVFAMPETAIGFFPDVGATIFLPKLPNSIGYYLALTGERLKGGDLVSTGIATHFVDSDKIEELESQLSSADNDQIPNILKKFSDKSYPSSQVPDVKKFEEDIDKLFSHPNLQKIMFNLETLSKEDSDLGRFAKRTNETLSQMSPTSLFITFFAMRDHLNRSNEWLFAKEYSISQKFMVRDDFYEGVRATLVDKDKKPKWTPATLDEVDFRELYRYFGPATETWVPYNK